VRLIDRDLGEANDGLFIDGGWAIEDSVKMFCPALKEDFLLVRNQRGPICTEEGG